MAKTLRLDIVTPARVVFSDEVEFISAPGSEGSLGVLPGHAPLLTGLNIGILKIKKSDETIPMAVSGGFMEVQKEKVVILADTAERGNEIDVLRAKAAKERAEKRLHEKVSNIDFARAEIALRKAMTRLKVANFKE